MNIKDNWLKLADGNQMPQEGFGLYKVDGQETMTNAIRDAYTAGYRLFDTAQLYGNEEAAGTAFKNLQIPGTSSSSPLRLPRIIKATIKQSNRFRNH